MSSRRPAHCIVSLGDLVTDLVIDIERLPVDAGQVLLASDIHVEPGGAGNFLIAGARLGVHMAALGVIGDDLWGRAMAEILESEGVDLAGVTRQPEGSTTAVAVLVDRKGEHVFIGALGKGAEVAFSPAWRSAIDQADAVFLAGYSLNEERSREACLRAIRYATARKVPVCLDPGPMMASVADELRQEVIRGSRVILATDDELPLLAPGKAGGEAVAALLESGPQVVCVKRGAGGCAIYSREGVVEQPAFPVQVVDTTAAGDSFDAAFIEAWLRGWSFDQVARFANAMGAAKVMKLGSGRQVPTAAKVQAVLDAFGVGLRV